MMNGKIRDIKSIQDLSIDDYNHLLENNLEFAKRNHIKARVPDDYSCIIKKGRFGNLTMFGNLQYLNISDSEAMNLSYMELCKLTNCMFTEDGLIAKNRWGDKDDNAELM